MGDASTRHLRLAGLGFVAAIILALALRSTTGFSWAALGAATGGALVVLRLFGPLPFPLSISVVLAATSLVSHPFGSRLLAEGATVAAVVQSHPVWAECLVLFTGARLLGIAAGRARRRRWMSPLEGPIVVADQSVFAALLMGGAVTLVIFANVPRLGEGTGAVDALLLSALQGSTPVHLAIVFTFATALSLIAGAGGLYIEDCLAFARLRRLARQGRLTDAASAAEAAGPLAGSRATVLVAGLLSEGDDLTLAALGGYQDAARQFVRRLIGFLPLLGFLGTVIGLAAAISGLPHGLQPGAAEMAASLGGLAVKFETTYLGLLAHLIASLLLGLLERLEADIRAGLMQLVAAIQTKRT